jgi:hypothetical protein
MAKRRLGVYPADEYFTDELAGHVRGAQMRLGMDPSGLIDEEFVNRLFMNSGSRPRG